MTGGSGWVGKGDVQNAVGWLNESALQTLVDMVGVGLTYTVTEFYLVIAGFFSGPGVNRNQHVVAETRAYGFVGVVGSESRQVKGQKQWSGFSLSGFDGGVPSFVGAGPEVGDHTVIGPQVAGLNSDQFVVAVDGIREHRRPVRQGCRCCRTPRLSSPTHQP